MESTKRILIERESLFQQIWNTPMVKLAKEYGLSDVGLAKICKKLNVPRPPQGYWAREHKGKPPKLPPTAGPTTHEFILDEPKVELPPEYVDPRTEKLIRSEQQSKNKITVKKTMRNIDPLVLETKQQLACMEPDQHNRFRTWKPGSFSVNICKESIPRGLLLFDTLIKEIKKRGMSIALTDRKTIVEVLDERISINLFEKVTRYEPDYTKAKHKKDNYLHYRYRFKPTGTLSLLIDTTGYYSSASISDKRNNPIENQLNDFFIKLYETAEKIKRSRIERERQQEEWRQRQKKLEATRAQKEHELKRQERLLTEVENWQKSILIRDYITAVQAKTPHQSDDQTAAWVIWASNIADQMDPLK